MITALPSLRREGGVKSGINATTGERQSDIIRLKQITHSISVQIYGMRGIRMKNNAAAGIPNSRYGLRLPKRLCVRSEILPNSG